MIIAENQVNWFRIVVLLLIIFSLIFVQKIDKDE